MRRALPTLLPVLLAACGQRGTSDVSAFRPSGEPPVLADLKVTCDGEKKVWTVQLATTSWAGGAWLVWTLDGVYLERQSGFRSVGAAPDGSSDQLRDDIGIVTDFRPYQDGVTAFTCRDVPTAAIVVLDLDREPADCVRAGPSPDLLVGVEGVPDCPRVFGVGDTDAPVDTDADTDVDTDG